MEQVWDFRILKLRSCSALRNMFILIAIDVALWE